MYGQIYLITNKINGKRYVGQTRQTVKRRWHAHCWEAAKGKNKAFSNAIRKYGPESFDVRAVADALDHETLNNFEYFYIRHLDTMNSEKGYNRREGGSQPKFGPETIEKFSAARKGRKLTPEWKQNIARALTGRSPSPETREKHRVRMLGNSLSLGVKRSEEYIQKLHRPHTEESRQKMSEARKLVKLDFGGNKNPFYGKKHSAESLEKMRSHVRTEEHCKNLSESKQGRKHPQYRHDVPTEHLIDLYSQGLGTVRIGKLVGLNGSSVYLRLKAAGIELRKSAWKVKNGG